MAEEQQQSPGAAQQPNDNSLNEPSIGMMYDKEKDQAKVFSQNPDGSIGTVDPTPENESLFFVMDKNIPLNFYKNLQKYHNNPTINVYVLPRRALGRMKDALKRYWKNTTRDDVKLYYNYKIHPDGKFECKMKTRGIRCRNAVGHAQPHGVQLRRAGKDELSPKVAELRTNGDAQAQIP